MVLPRSLRGAVVNALRQVHPYEEPAFDVFELADQPGSRGVGRIGQLREPMTLSEFADEVVLTLPPTAVGARVAGDLHGEVSTVAVVGGSGDFMLDKARAAGVDVYVTSDLRHHPASEATEHVGAPALVDVPHWSAEWTWLPVAERRLQDSFRDAGLAVTTQVSTLCTDPWNYRVARRDLT
jgi:putative NIF3 family GTP cyclohydrolase 1 type 2